MKLGIHFMQLTLLEAFNLYNRFSGNRCNLYDFRLSVLENLFQIDPNPTSKRSLPQPVHVIFNILEKNNEGETKSKRCRVCSEQKQRRATVFHCVSCEGEHGLCAGECFRKYHEYN
ncbi:hypothetical protein JTB14_001474 [Gonioctena quinquepunctata]|nr:hypothetical protein JTB14_001474 [Gonioctena quinquepunctata]